MGTAVSVSSPEVLDTLESLGYPLCRYKSLKKVARIDSDVNREELRAIPGVIEVGCSEEGCQGAASQTIEIVSSLDQGSYALPRICRRRPSWDTTHIVTPFNTTYQYSLTGDGVDLYVVDSGTESTHPEFTGRSTQIYDFYDVEEEDDHGHGTAVAGCAAGDTVGPARDSLIFSVKVLDENNEGTTSAILAGIDEVATHYSGRAATNRPAVLNFSIVVTSVSPTVRVALEELIDSGVVVIACAGNGNTPQELYNSIEIMLVGGTGPSDIPYKSATSHTNYGSEVDILAPGQNVYTASHIGGYRTYTGTSFSSPLVAGVAACMLEGHDRITTGAQVAQVKAYIEAQATTGYFTPEYGYDPLPDKIVYLSPTTTFHNIFG